MRSATITYARQVMSMSGFLFVFGLTALFLACASGIRDYPAIHLIGDSTMSEKLPEKRPETGWGEMLPEWIDDRIRIVNHAKNGRSTRSFLEEGRWDTVLGMLENGDFVFIQFGHNDESKKKVERYTSPEDYEKNLVKYVKETRDNGAHPVLMTPLMRRRFDAHGIFYDTHGVYPDIVRKVAKENKVPLIDMHKKSRRVIKAYGEEGSRALFLWLSPGDSVHYPEGLTDNTHFSPKGAREMAALAVEGILELKLKLSRYVKELPVRN